jgi:5-methylcytosine-specific restriction endonuclease McrA
MSRNKKTLVLDSSYLARSIISTDRAFVITYKGNADVVNEYDESFKVVNPKLDIKKPSIIKVFTYVKTVYNKVALTRENIFRRDNFECVYCGDDNKKDLTLDHVIPQSKGGPHSWDNLVSACKKCNSLKADYSLEEFGKEIPKPYRPHYLMLMRQMEDVPDEWKPYLFLD